MTSHQKHTLLHVAGLVLFAAAAVASVDCRRSPPSQAFVDASPRASASKLSKIVFVGKEHACECTRKSVDTGWTTLQKTLGSQSTIPVERIQVDTESARVEPYRAQKPIMALPAVYFIDAKGSVLDMVQGEVTEAQIQPILKRTR
jgi:hypothetical protein